MLTIDKIAKNWLAFIFGLFVHLRISTLRNKLVLMAGGLLLAGKVVRQSPQGLRSVDKKSGRGGYS
jgi:hypothetical protein